MELLWPKACGRIFQLVSSLGDPYDALVDQVLTGIEIRTFFVPDCTLKLAGPPPLRDGIDCLGSAAVPVELLDWLPVACQEVRWGSPTPERALQYDHNLLQTVLPIDGSNAPGPAAFRGHLTLDPRRCRTISPEAFCMLFAHTLIQVFRVMLVLIPAGLDWQRFRAVTRYGKKPWRQLATETSPAPTNARHPAILATTQAFWPPPLVHRWFRAYWQDVMATDHARTTLQASAD